MDLAELPPRPDPHTGEPRPPRAPGSKGDYTTSEHQTAPEKGPLPPSGQGPALEHYSLSKRESLTTGLAGFVIVAVGTTIAAQGQWVFYPWPWIIVVVGAALIGWNARHLLRRRR